MTGTTELSTIITAQIVTETITSHFTDHQDIQNFSFTNKQIYFLLTTSSVAKNVWSHFIAQHNQKISPDLYVTLFFQPRVHRNEDGSAFETFNVFEMKFFCPLQDRTVMQCRQIPYIDEPTLHLLAQDRKLEEETSFWRSTFPDFHLSHTRPTRDILMRKEILNWLRCLYSNFKAFDVRGVNMYNSYIGSSFNFHSFFHEMQGDDTPDFDLTELRSQGQMLNGQNGRDYSTYRQIIDVLLSGCLSFDQFKSFMWLTSRPGIQYMPEQIKPVVFELFQDLKELEKVKSHPLDTLLFFKKVYEIVEPFALQNANLLLRENRLKQALTEMITLPGFSCNTFCAVFLPKKLEHQSIERVLDRLELFLEAARNGTLNLFLVNEDFERNTNLHIPLFDMNRAFYQAVHSGFIPLSALINGKAPIGDFYDRAYLITDELDAHALGLNEPEQLEFSRHLNRFYNQFMTLVRDHPDQKMDRHAFMCDAIQFLKMMKLFSVDFMSRLFSQSDAEYAYKQFLAFRDKTQKIYHDTILEHFKSQSHQDIMLSAKVKDFIIPHTKWIAMILRDEHSSYETWLKLLEETYQSTLTTGYSNNLFQLLSDYSVNDLEEAVKQIDQLSQHQDPQKLTPTLTNLMSLRTGLARTTIEECYEDFGLLIPLFKQCNFPVQFSIWDLLNVQFPNWDLLTVHNQLKFHLMKKPLIQSITPETWIEHITLMKNEALKLGALYFGTEAGYQICQSFFSSPKRIIDVLLLLSSGQWTKDKYIKVVKTFISMHYEYACMEYYQYEHVSMTFSRTHPTPMPVINVGLPDESDYHAFDPHIFIDAILEATLSHYLSGSNTSERDLWNNACRRATLGKIIH